MLCMSDSEWYVAVLVLRAVAHAPSPDEPLTDHQVRLIHAVDPESAYQRAMFLGRSEEHTYANTAGHDVSWQFQGLHDLVELPAAPALDGAEVYSFRLHGSAAFAVMPKEKL